MEAMGYKKQDKYFEELQNHTYKCICGHTMVITNKTKKAICSHCYRTVYKNKKDEFMDRIGTKLYGRKDI